MFIQRYTGAVSEAQHPQWIFEAALIDGLPWHLEDEIAPIEVLLHKYVTPVEANAWYFSKYQSLYRIQYCASRLHWRGVAYTSFDFASLCLHLLSYYGTKR